MTNNEKASSPDGENRMENVERDGRGAIRNRKFDEQEEEYWIEKERVIRNERIKQEERKWKRNEKKEMRGEKEGKY